MKRGCGLALALVLSGGVVALGSLSCGQDCQVDIGDPITDPFRRAQKSCWPIGPGGKCGDFGRPATCEGTKLSCPSGYQLGEACGLFRQPDAGAGQ